MSFLAPLFLLGALGVVLPVVFHLVQRTARERIPFSSLMFLRPTPLRLTRRSRLEHLLLLLLRCLALVLVASAFARPFLKRALAVRAPDRGIRRLVLVDTSASMRRPGLWAEALSRAESDLRAASPGDATALLTFDRGLKPLVTFQEWESMPVGRRVPAAMQKLRQNPPGWAGTWLGPALIRAAEMLGEPGGRTLAEGGQVLLISDLQEGSHLGTLQGYEWPKGVEIKVQLVKPAEPGNAGLQLLPQPEDDRSAGVSSGVRVRVSNAPDSTREQFQVGWANTRGALFRGQPTAVYVPAGQSRIISLSPPPPGELPGSVLLGGDDMAFDNLVYVVPAERQVVEVAYLGKESETDPRQPLYFLERAFQQTGGQGVQVLQRPDGLTREDAALEKTRLFVVSESLEGSSLENLRRQLLAGKTALVVLTSPGMASTLAGLLGLQSVHLTEAKPRDYALLGTVDFRHPLFAPFSDPQFSDFSNIHFWRYRRLEPAEFAGHANESAGSRDPDVPTDVFHVLAKFDNSDLALVEARVGRGRIFILTSGWQPGDSQLALSTKFVPLLYSLLDLSGVPAQGPSQYHVGDVVPIPGWGTPVQDVHVRLPDQSEAPLAAGQTNFSGTTLPGIYEVLAGPRHFRFAVNLDPAESQTAVVSDDELGGLGVPLAQPKLTQFQAVRREARLENADLEAQQKLWRLLLVLALVVLLVETWLAGRASTGLNLRGEKVSS